MRLELLSSTFRMVKLYKRTWMKKEGALEVAAAVLTSVQMKPLTVSPTPLQMIRKKALMGSNLTEHFLALPLTMVPASLPLDAFSGAFCRANLHHARQNNITYYKIACCITTHNYHM